VGWLYIGLLALALVVLIAAEWPRLGTRFGLENRKRRERARRKRMAAFTSWSWAGKGASALRR
jgi:hypothetical protein